MDRNERFKDKVAVVTGAASGIGAATARLLVSGGARVVLADVNHQAGKALAEELGSDRAQFRFCDVSSQVDAEALIAFAQSRWGWVGIPHNNAGVLSVATTPDLAPSQWHRVIGINLNSIIFLCRAPLPGMIQRNSGAIVNTASVSGLRADHGFSAYNATKAAVINHTRSLSLDHAAEGIRINAACPGGIATPMVGVLDGQSREQTTLSGIPMGRLGQPATSQRPSPFSHRTRPASSRERPSSSSTVGRRRTLASPTFRMPFVAGMRTLQQLAADRFRGSPEIERRNRCTRS